MRRSRVSRLTTTPVVTETGPGYILLHSAASAYLARRAHESLTSVCTYRLQHRLIRLPHGRSDKGQAAPDVTARVPRLNSFRRSRGGMCADILPSYGRGKNMHHDFFLTHVIIYLTEITSHNPSTLKQNWVSRKWSFFCLATSLSLTLIHPPAGLLSVGTSVEPNLCVDYF
jgi:hypothetical protein